jgi:DNA-binding MurR/RpiR family transcriptional regulator
MFGVAARASSLARMEPLTDLDCRLLSLLIQHNRSVPQCTTNALARDAHVHPAEMRRILAGLEPPAYPARV